MLYLPKQNWITAPVPTPVVERDVLNESAATSAARDQQLSVAAENAPLRVLYGTVTIGPQIACVLPYQGNLVLLCVWGHGEVDSITQLYLDDKPATLTATHYTGTAGQTVNSTLVAAFAAQTPPQTYTDALPGICYSVVTVPPGTSAGFPRLTATIKGRKVYDPRQNLLLWSERFDNAVWTKQQTTATVDAAVAPDGTISADKLVEDTSTNLHLARQVVSTVSGSTYTISFYVKADGRTKISIGIYTNAGVSTNYDLAASVASNASGTITAVGNDWYRCTRTFVSGFTGSCYFEVYLLSGSYFFSYAGDGASGIYIWGAQLHQGSSLLAYTPTTTTAVNPVTAWSNNPALCLADFVTHASYGMAKTVDWPSVSQVAIDCDVLAGGSEKLRTLDLCLDNVQPVQNWLDTLRTYAGCWVVQSGADLKLISDKVTATSDSFDHASGQIMSLTGLKKRGVQGTPTVMTVTYRDTTAQPERDGKATVYAPGVLAGSTPRRESAVSLPGITRYSQAVREATERLNKLLLNDLSCNLTVFDEALSVDVGDVITVTHPIGLTSKAMRVMDVSGAYGRYALNLVEYDPAVYDASVSTAPTFTDTNLPNPSAPPAVSGVTMAEEVYQLENGNYASRWRITWTAAAYTFLAYYRAELRVGGTLVQSGSPNSAEWVTGPVKEGDSYTAQIAAVSSIGATGTWASQSAVAQGKTLIPGNVPSIAAFEAGGRVYVSWTPAIDIDIWRYEVRYGAVGVAWASTTLIDRVDALRLTSDQLPVGTWTIHVKALDSVQQYSTTAATVNVTVTSDASAFLIDTKLQTAPTLTNMAEYSLARTDTNRYFVTEDGVTFATKYSAALSTYTNPLATYHNSVTSTWLGESEDFGLDLGGQWTGVATVADLSGTHISYMGTAVAAAPSTFTYAGLSQKVNARFARLKHEALTTSTMLVTVPDQSIKVDAIPREEVGSGTSSAAGPVTITLANAYVAVKEITITPQGTTARSATFDNVVLSTPTTFDVYVFNDAGVKIASPFQYKFKGV